MEIILDLLRGFQAGRLVESLIFLGVLWIKVKPHLKRVEDRMAGIEKGMMGINQTVTMGFQSGETRFSAIENRLDKVEGSGEPKLHTH
jgi:hypothetical protein